LLKRFVRHYSVLQTLQRALYSIDFFSYRSTHCQS
jgi:hypothetical protein